MRIFDGHCHIWERWSYRPDVPDPDSRASVGQLLHEMDLNGVEKALVICAGIGGNPANADYAFASAERHPGRLVVFPDVECRWSPDFRTPGAAGRLEAALGRWPMAGFTEYLTEEEDGSWLTSEEGLAFHGLAAERCLVASLSVLPHQMPHVVALAERFPSLPIMCHHFAFLGPRTSANPQAGAQVRAAAATPNVHIKVSGMGNVAGPGDEYPYPDLAWVWRAITEAFPPERLIWGSDYPVSRKCMIYRQTRLLVERHAPVPADALPAVFGGNLERLLAGRAS